MRLSAIVAMASNRVIGAGNQLPWRLPEDLARFKRLTLGHTLLMGRKTFESIGRVLPGRTTLVISRQPGYSPPGVQVARSVDEALALAQAHAPPGDEVFIAGGAQLYAQTASRWHRLYLTALAREVPGDTLFPDVDLSSWKLLEREDHTGFSFLTYER